MRTLSFAAAVLLSFPAAAQQEQGWGPGNPPSCTDERYQRRAIRSYEDLETMPNRGGRKISSTTQVKDMGVAPLSLGALAAVAPPDFKGTIRYCQAELKLDNGESDILFYRFAVIEEGRGKKPKVEVLSCATRHDTLKDNCSFARPR